MNPLLVFLFLFAVGCFIWGLIAPKHIAKKAHIKKDVTRKHVGIVFMPLLFGLIILVGLTAPPQPKTINLQPASVTKQPDQTSSTPVTTSKEETETQTIPFTTQNENDSSLAKGRTKIVQAGQNGTETLTYKITYTDGKQTDKTLVSTTVTTQPTNQITAIGTYVAPAPQPAPTPTPTPSPSCYPLTNGGNCYEPGEYCRNSDHGASGLAGDGESITCAYNNGWRWEPK